MSGTGAGPGRGGGRLVGAARERAHEHAGQARGHVQTQVRRHGWRTTLMTGLVSAGLLGVLAVTPRDQCAASMTGACVSVAREPFAVDAKVGEPVTLHTGTVTVTRVRATRMLQGPPVGSTPRPPVQAPPGTVLLYVEVTAAPSLPNRRPTGMLTTGRYSYRYDEDRYAEAIPPTLYPVDLETKGALVFALPDRRLTDDSTLYVAFAYGQAVKVDLDALPRVPSITVEGLG